MSYQGSEAVNFETVEEQRSAQQQERRSSFEVVSGGGLDARARRGVSRQFVARLKVVVAVAAVFIVLGACRVGLSVATVSTLQNNSTLKTQIEEAQETNDELSIERSVLSSNSRVNQIAETYGMTLATDVETLTVTGTTSDAATSDATSDDEAAQTEDASAVSEDL